MFSFLSEILCRDVNVKVPSLVKHPLVGNVFSELDPSPEGAESCSHSCFKEPFGGLLETAAKGDFCVMIVS